MSDGSHNARCFACRRGARCRKVSEQTAQAWGRPGNHRHHQTIAPDRRRVDPWLALLGACVVNHETRLKIIQPVEYQIDITNVVFNVRWIHIVHSRFDEHGGIHTAQFRLCSDSFGKVVLDVVFIEERLPLQIGKLDKIPVDHPQKSNAGTHNLIGGDCAERTEPNQEDAGRSEPLLAFLPDRRESYLSGITIIAGQGPASPASRFCRLRSPAVGFR